jgi:chloramphenicol-sensitive protein RarD
MSEEKAKVRSLGLLFGVSAYTLWGLFPIYWLLLKPASAIEIVSHRAVWTLVFCFIVLWLTKTLSSTLALLKRPKIVAGLFLSSILISVNWIIYIYAATSNHVVEAALGYYINPIVVIATGVIVLKEKMRPLQWASLGVATLGVAVLTIDYGRLPWIALGLGLSWGSYGLVKKKLGLGALEGLSIETLISSGVRDNLGSLGESPCSVLALGQSRRFHSYSLMEQQIDCHLLLLAYCNTSHQHFSFRSVSGISKKICLRLVGPAS